MLKTITKTVNSVELKWILICFTKENVKTPIAWNNNKKKKLFALEQLVEVSKFGTTNMFQNYIKNLLLNLISLTTS